MVAMGWGIHSLDREGLDIDLLSLFCASGLRSPQGSDLEYPLRIETVEWSHWDSRV